MPEKEKMICPNCGIPMNYHADKIDYTADVEAVDPEFGGVVEEVHSCAGCGETATRRESS